MQDILEGSSETKKVRKFRNPISHVNLARLARNSCLKHFYDKMVQKDYERKFLLPGHAYKSFLNGKSFKSVTPTVRFNLSNFELI